jgi:hypothetical protein
VKIGRSGLTRLLLDCHIVFQPALKLEINEKSVSSYNKQIKKTHPDLRDIHMKGPGLGGRSLVVDIDVPEDVHFDHLVHVDKVQIIHFGWLV